MKNCIDPIDYINMFLNRSICCVDCFLLEVCYTTSNQNLFLSKCMEIDEYLPDYINRKRWDWCCLFPGSQPDEVHRYYFDEM